MGPKLMSTGMSPRLHRTGDAPSPRREMTCLPDEAYGGGCGSRGTLAHLAAAAPPPRTPARWGRANVRARSYGAVVRSTEPVHYTFLLHPEVDLDAVVVAYASEGWQRDTGRGSLCRINGVDYRLFPMKRLGRIVEKDWRRDARQPYDIPPGWTAPAAH